MIIVFIFVLYVIFGIEFITPQNYMQNICSCTCAIFLKRVHSLHHFVIYKKLRTTAMKYRLYGLMTINMSTQDSVNDFFPIEWPRDIGYS